MPVLGFPNGSLSGHTQALLECAGVELPEKLLKRIEERRYLFPLSPNGVHPFDKLQVLRPQDMPLAIIEGMIDVGFSGQDWFIESSLEKDLDVIATFNYSKAQLKPPKIVILGKRGKDFHDTEATVVATEYPVLARKKFKKARIIVVHGKAESWVVGDGAHFCVDLYDRGTTTRINNLKIVGEKIISSPTVLLIHKKSPLLTEINALVKKLNKAFTELKT